METVLSTPLNVFTFSTLTMASKMYGSKNMNVARITVGIKPCIYAAVALDLKTTFKKGISVVKLSSLVSEAMSATGICRKRRS